MRFVLDHNLAPNLARAIALLVKPQGHEVTCLEDLGLRAADDEEWIRRLAADPPWIVITCDLDIVRNPLRQGVFRKARLTTFFLLESWSNGSALGTDIAQRLLKIWPEITQRAIRHDPGSCFAVPFKGTIRRFAAQGKRPI